MTVTHQHADSMLRNAFALALIAFLLLSAADVFSTWYALTHGGGHEVNGLVAALLAHSGIGAFAAVKGTTSLAEAGIFLLGYLLMPGRWRWLTVTALALADAWLFALVSHNLFLVLLTPHLFL